MAHTVHLSDKAYRLFEQRADRLGLSVTDYLNQGAPKRTKSRMEGKPAKAASNKIHCEATGADYTPRAWGLSKDIYRQLRSEWDVLKRGPITYQQLGEAVGVHHRTLRKGLEVIQAHCRVRGWPTLTAFVVTKHAGLPSSGCDVTEVDEFASASAQARKIDWPKEPWW